MAGPPASPLDGPPAPDAHSRLVGLAKVALPMGGLVLLSSLFLLAGEGGRPAAPLVPEARGIAREQRLSAPVHAGVTEAGDAVEIAADLARPDARDPRLMRAEGIRARVVTARGAVLDLHAASGEIDTGAGVARLSGGLRLRGESARTGAASEGDGDSGAGPIEAEAEAMRFDLRTGRAESAGPVRASAPLGTIEAGAMTIEGGRIDFSSGVRIVHLPPSRGGPAEE